MIHIYLQQWSVLYQQTSTVNIPINTNTFLHKAVTSNTTNIISYSQALRVKHICSSNETVTKRLHELRGFFYQTRL